MTASLPPLPEPFTSLPVAGSQTTSIHVWASDAMLAYAAAEREAIAQWLDEQQRLNGDRDNHAAFYARAIRSMGKDTK